VAQARSARQDNGDLLPSKTTMNEDMKLGAVVLAGGQGSRMNGFDT